MKKLLLAACLALLACEGEGDGAEQLEIDAGECAGGIPAEEACSMYILALIPQIYMCNHLIGPWAGDAAPFTEEQWIENATQVSARCDEFCSGYDAIDPLIIIDIIGGTSVGPIPEHDECPPLPGHDECPATPEHDGCHMRDPNGWRELPEKNRLCMESVRFQASLL